MQKSAEAKPAQADNSQTAHHSVCLDKEALEMLLKGQVVRSDIADDEIDLAELWRGLVKRKALIFTMTFLVTLAAAVAALNMTPKYESKVLLAPVGEGDSTAGLMAKYGGLASLAGISLPSSKDGVSKVAEAKAILTSYQFLSEYIAKHNLKPVLFASRWDSDAQMWRKTEESLITNAKMAAFEAMTFRDGISPADKAQANASGEPSMQEAVKQFKELVQISEEKDSGMVSVKVTWSDAVQAQFWANDLVHEVDQLLREKAIKASENVIAYLQEKLPTMQLADIRNMALSLIEQEMKKVTFARVHPEYVYKVIDPAIVADQPASPKKALMVAVGFVLGLMLSIFMALILNVRSGSSVTEKD
ncbi:MAG: hypothetical protein JXR44_07760 [Thiotrichales bacterium]|nr:hypothetical protein [Thiotrichales bacterium]